MNGGFLKRATDEANKHRLPCHIAVTDFVCSSGPSALVRLIVIHLNDAFVVKQFTVKMVRGTLTTNEVRLLSTPHAWEAHDKISEQSTCLELENWTFVREEVNPIYDVSANLPAKEHQPPCMSIGDIVKRIDNTRHCHVRQLPKGFFSRLTVSPNGQACIHMKNGVSVAASDSIATAYRQFSRVSGAKGFACEGIFDGTRFFMTDVLFLHDKWVGEGGYIEREELVHSYLKTHSISCSSMLKQHEVRPSILPVIINDNVRAMLVYTQGERMAVSETPPKRVSIGGEKIQSLYDESLSKIGYMKPLAGADLSYLSFHCLHIDSGHLGLEGIFF